MTRTILWVGLLLGGMLWQGVTQIDTASLFTQTYWTGLALFAHWLSERIANWGTPQHA